MVIYCSNGGRSALFSDPVFSYHCQRVQDVLRFDGGGDKQRTRQRSLVPLFLKFLSCRKERMKFVKKESTIYKEDLDFLFYVVTYQKSVQTVKN